MRNAMSPDEGNGGRRGECQKYFGKMQYRTRTCADSIQAESGSKERVCDLLLPPVEDDILPYVRQGVDCRDTGS